MGGGWLISDHRLLKNTATEGTEKTEGGEPNNDGRLKTAGRFTYQSWKAEKRREAPTFSMGTVPNLDYLERRANSDSSSRIESIHGINIRSA